MDKKLRLIQYLYGEDVNTEQFRKLLDEDPALRREYLDLRTIKQQMDEQRAAQRPSSQAPARPDAAVVDRIVQAAGAAARSSTTARTDRPQADRAPARPRPSVVQRMQWAGAALAVVLVALVGWWSLDQDLARPATEALSADQPAATEAARPEAEAAGRPDATPRALGAPASGFSLSAPANDPFEQASALSWDEGDDVVHLHQHLELLEARSTPTRWDASGYAPARQIRPLGR